MNPNSEKKISGNKSDDFLISIVVPFYNEEDNVIKLNNSLLNVLQSMILTKGKKMLLTPTYHVFDMYKVHQENILLPIKINTENYVQGRRSIPAINGSASIDSDNQLYISLSNINPNQGINVEIIVNDFNIGISELKAEVLRSEQINAHNTFEAPETVKPEKYTNDKFSIKENKLVFKMPSKAILVIKIK